MNLRKLAKEQMLASVRRYPWYGVRWYFRGFILIDDQTGVVRHEPA